MKYFLYIGIPCVCTIVSGLCFAAREVYRSISSALEDDMSEDY